MHWSYSDSQSDSACHYIIVLVVIKRENDEKVVRDTKGRDANPNPNTKKESGPRLAAR